jgi:lysophospholipase L1-like esterase
VQRRAGAIAVAILLCLLLVPAAAGAAQASLGDSYSSGEGTSDYDSGTRTVIGNGCHRSRHAWPRLLGALPEAHFACSGAKTENFFKGQKSGLRARADSASQLDRLAALAASKPISRVFATIGGNDLGFGKIIRDCVIKTCLRRMGEVELPRLRNVVIPAVTAALTATKQTVAGAEVLLVGYPDLIPPPLSPSTGCRWLSAFERVRVRRLQTKLDAALSIAATAAGTPYVSIRPALAGHELCTAESWVNPIARLATLFSQEQGHPNESGQLAIARYVADRLPPTAASRAPGSAPGQPGQPSAASLRREG